MTTVLRLAADNLKIFRLTTVANTCLVFYEYSIKFDDEVRYLWQRKPSFASTLLTFCRYLPIASTLEALYSYVLMSNTSGSRCLKGVIANSSLIYIQFSVSVLVLFTRAYAVWGATRRMLYILTAIYAVASAGTSYSLYLHIRGYLPLDLHIGNGCVFVIGNTHIWYALVIHIGCETLALILLLIKSVQHASFMKMNNVRMPSAGGGSGRRSVNLLMVMAQDGIGYFLLNLAVTVTNVIVMMRVGTGLRDFLLTVHGALQNILCARLLFHLQIINDAAFDGTHHNYHYPHGPGLSGIEFASGNGMDMEMSGGSTDSDVTTTTMSTVGKEKVKEKDCAGLEMGVGVGVVPGGMRTRAGARREAGTGIEVVEVRSREEEEAEEAEVVDIEIHERRRSRISESGAGAVGETERRRSRFSGWW
ncbi:hypothetical protein SCHPADRAFT_894807 [Schizopora paradoxa]|uniref:DUF6533 domain-containing protein n=1 Tax=Schizopora paradoxa TaxID=27342 RepID=A0A0H2R5X0_9AGAM|nr:hypothetical protein SCHPADRAFT_894807 [Schizopora paradoxa]